MLWFSRKVMPLDENNLKIFTDNSYLLFPPSVYLSVHTNTHSHPQSRFLTTVCIVLILKPVRISGEGKIYRLKFMYIFLCVYMHTYTADNRLMVSVCCLFAVQRYKRWNYNLISCHCLMCILKQHTKTMGINT